MTGAVQDCMAGLISPEVALARLVLAGLTREAIGRSLPAGSALAALFEARRESLGTVVRMLAESGIDHVGAHTPRTIAAMFDRAVAASPEASVAAYTLGDPALLARATQEVTDWLRGLGAIHAGARVLDLGCGIGRMAASLSPHVASVLGLDVSSGMVAEARRRHDDLANVWFAHTDGTPPSLPAASVDLVLAVDSFPYLVQAGLADRHTEIVASALTAAGWLVILNLSYDGLDGDVHRAEGWARQFGLELVVCGERPFTLWDGTAFVLRQFQRPLPLGEGGECFVTPQPSGAGP